MITKFWHVGFTVTDLEKAIKEYEALGFTVEQRFQKPEPKLVAAHMSHQNGSNIEIFQLVGPDHPQMQYLKNHLAFITDDIKTDRAELEKQGMEVVIPITEGITVKHFAYLRDASGRYIELAQK